MDVGIYFYFINNTSLRWWVESILFRFYKLMRYIIALDSISEINCLSQGWQKPIYLFLITRGYFCLFLNLKCVLRPEIIIKIIRGNFFIF